MCFKIKSTLKNNYYHTFKHTLDLNQDYPVGKVLPRVRVANILKFYNMHACMPSIIHHIGSCK
jgi:hypothetical protein